MHAACILIEILIFNFEREIDLGIPKRWDKVPWGRAKSGRQPLRAHVRFRIHFRQKLTGKLKLTKKSQLSAFQPHWAQINWLLFKPIISSHRSFYRAQEWLFYQRIDVLNYI